MTGGTASVRALSAEETRGIGRRLAALLRAGDVVVLDGDLGAGKTTLVQGIGAGLHVSGQVTSPTFVISRVHPSLCDGPALVHVDAYRLRDGGELDGLDLDETLADAVTVVEWGDGLADVLSPDRLRIQLSRHRGTELDGVRTIAIQGVGSRWSRVQLESVLDAAIG